MLCLTYMICILSYNKNDKERIILKTTFTFRIEIETLEKLRFIALEEKRTVSNLIDISTQYIIDKFEKEHGMIEELIIEKNTRKKKPPK